MILAPPRTKLSYELTSAQFCLPLSSLFEQHLPFDYRFWEDLVALLQAEVPPGQSSYEHRKHVVVRGLVWSCLPYIWSIVVLLSAHRPAFFCCTLRWARQSLFTHIILLECRLPFTFSYGNPPVSTVAGYFRPGYCLAYGLKLDYAAYDHLSSSHLSNP